MSIIGGSSIQIEEGVYNVDNVNPGSHATTSYPSREQMDNSDISYEVEDRQGAHRIDEKTKQPDVRPINDVF